MTEANLDRDSHYRVAALRAAISRAGQDGGLEGGLDVLAMANTYYSWLTGDTSLHDPVFEEAQKPVTNHNLGGQN